MLGHETDSLESVLYPRGTPVITCPQLPPAGEKRFAPKGSLLSTNGKPFTFPLFNRRIHLSCCSMLYCIWTAMHDRILNIMYHTLTINTHNSLYNSKLSLASGLPLLSSLPSGPATGTPPLQGWRASLMITLYPSSVSKPSIVVVSMGLRLRLTRKGRKCSIVVG